MYYTLTCKIRIGQYVLNGVNAIVIKKSVHTLIQTAVLSLPLSVVKENKETKSTERVQLADKIKEGDPITIEIGYNGSLKNEFTGYVKRINYKQPLEIECEDALYLLRKVYFKESYRNISAKELINKVIDKLNVESGLSIKIYNNTPDVTIGNFYPQGKSGVWVLEELKKFGVTTYLYDNSGVLTLFAGLAYDLQKGRVKYKFGYNTISHDDLKYQGGEDKKYKVNVVNFKRDGTQQKETFGEEGGDSVTINTYNATGTSQMKLLADAEVIRLKTSGYKGTIETFLIPEVMPGMIADVSDPQFPDRAGSYYVGTVETTFDTNGARRKPSFEIRVK